MQLNGIFTAEDCAFLREADIEPHINAPHAEYPAVRWFPKEVRLTREVAVRRGDQGVLFVTGDTLNFDPSWKAR